MSRFILFAGETYCSKGGAHDRIDSFGSLVEAEAYGQALLAKEGRYFDWFHVFDIGTSSIVAKSATQASGAPDDDAEGKA